MRLVEEVTRSDTLEKKLKETQLLLDSSVTVCDRRNEELNDSRRKVLDLTENLTGTTRLLERCEGEKTRLLAVVEELDAKV